MRNRLNIFIVFIVTTCLVLPISAALSAALDPNRYLNAVRTFADNVLKYGGDTYPKHTPLFVDGLNVHTREENPVRGNEIRWRDKKNECGFHNSNYGGHCDAT
jgi:hypothetical protein